MGDLRKAAEMAIKCYAARENIKLSKAMQTLELALAQPEQEQYVTKVVAVHEDGTYTTERIPLPKREWVGLDKSDMNVLLSVSQFTSDAKGFIRLVEEKLKEKNT